MSGAEGLEEEPNCQIIIFRQRPGGGGYGEWQEGGFGRGRGRSRSRDVTHCIVRPASFYNHPVLNPLKSGASSCRTNSNHSYRRCQTSLPLLPATDPRILQQRACRSSSFPHVYEPTRPSSFAPRPISSPGPCVKPEVMRALSYLPQPTKNIDKIARCSCPLKLHCLDHRPRLSCAYFSTPRYRHDGRESLKELINAR